MFEAIVMAMSMEPVATLPRTRRPVRFKTIFPNLNPEKKNRTGKLFNSTMLPGPGINGTDYFEKLRSRFPEKVRSATAIPQALPLPARGGWDTLGPNKIRAAGDE